MRHASSVVLGLVLLVPVVLPAQTPARKPPVAKKTSSTAPKDLAQRLVDSAATAAASMATDSVLGPNAATVAAVMAAMGSAGAIGVPSCGPGQVPYPVLNAASVAGAQSGAGSAMSSMMPGASAGASIVDAAKKKLLSQTPTPATKAVAAGLGAPRFLCGTPEQAMASIQAAVAGAQSAQAATAGAQAGRAGLAAQAMQVAQGGLAGQAGLAAQAMQAAQGGLAGQAGLAAQAASAGQTGMPSVASMLAATPQGMMVNGAIAAAPMAGAAAKKLGGFLRGARSKESMAGDLAKGKLVLKAVKFVEGTDMLVSDAEAEFPALAEAVKAVEGQFVLNVPAESDGKSAPDTVMAKRRLAKIAALLIAAGIPADRVTTRGVQPPGLDPKISAPKPGSARAELIRVPPESKP